MLLEITEDMINFAWKFRRENAAVKGLIFSFLFFSVLATSGIDYDIKLWAPLQEQPLYPGTADEVRHVCPHCKEELIIANQLSVYFEMIKFKLYRIQLSNK